MCACVLVLVRASTCVHGRMRVMFFLFGVFVRVCVCVCARVCAGASTRVHVCVRGVFLCAKV